jgi:inhibitor of KinA sporulation pathway (predicted exonuclease)
MKPSTAVAHIKSALAYQRTNIALDRVLVIDLEATTGADRERDALRDIIQIGACLLRVSDGRIENADSVLVRPTSSEVTPFCTDLTGITPAMAEGGLPFVDACAWLQTKYDAKSKPWASYGNYDRIQFVVQCEREGLPYPLSHDHVNIKLVVALHAGWPKGKGLTRALAVLKMKLEGRHHDAKDDAINAARLLHRALRTDGVRLK